MDILLKLSFRVGFTALVVCSSGAAYANSPPTIEVRMTALVNSPLNTAYMKKFMERLTKAKGVNFSVDLVPVDAAKGETGIDENPGLLILAPTPAYVMYTASADPRSAKKAQSTIVRDVVQSSTARLGFKNFKDWSVIGHFVNGPEIYVMKQPLYSIHDLYGKRIRVEPSHTMDSLDAFGAYGIPFPYSKKLPVNSSTVFDGALIPDPEAITPRWYAKTPNLVFNGVAYSSTLILARKNWFKKLSPKMKIVVQNVVSDMEIWATKSSVKRNVQAAKKWQEIGGSIFFLDQPPKKELVAPMHSPPSDLHTKGAFRKFYGTFVKNLAPLQRRTQ